MNELMSTFDFVQDYSLENEVAILSPLNKKNIKELVGISEEAEIWTFFLEKGHGEEQLNNYCHKALANRVVEKEYPFIIYDKRKNKYAGMTRLYDFNRELQGIKVGHTFLGKDFWSTQLNQHCKFLLFEFIFDQLGLERVGFGVHGQNTRSIKALKNIGCVQEGRLRNFLPMLSEEGRVDLFLFSLLSIEWKSSVKAMLQRKLK